MVNMLSGWKSGRILLKKKIKTSRVGLVLLFLMDWQALMPNVMLEFLNKFLIKGTNIYFGHKDKV
jgi:hypothetical protein